jgi:uncharacterized membrane protein
MKSEITPTTSSETNPTARLEAFSDGVFSIAITLLVFNIAVPRELDPDQPLFAALLTLAPSYFAFFLSFLTIGIMWINHHNLFKVIHRTDHVLLVMNLLLLLMITFVNFPTAVLGAYIGDPANQLTASLLYGGTFVITAVVFNLLWRYASRRLLHPQADMRMVQGVTRQYAFGPLLYLVAMLLSFISVYLSLAAHLALALFFAIPSRSNLFNGD